MPFNPDTYLKEKAAPPAAFDPDAYLAAKGAANVNPPQGREAARPAPPPEAEPSFLDKLIGGGEAALTMGTGMIAAPAGAVAGIAHGLADGYGTPEGAQRASQFGGQVASKFTYQPRTAKGKDYVENVGSALDASKIAGLGVPEATALSGAASVAAPAVKATTGAAGQAVKGSAPAQAVAGAARRAKSAMGFTIDPETRRLAQVAEQNGIPLRPDMFSKNPVLRSMGEALEQVPLSGAKGEKRQTAFNKAVMKTIGADTSADKLTPDVFSGALDKSGSAIGEIAGRNKLQISPILDAQLNEHINEASALGTRDIAHIVPGYIGELKGLAVDGVVDGTAWRRWNSKVGARIRSTNDGDLRHALAAMQSDVMDEMQSMMPAKDVARFNEARMQYARGISLIPLVAKSPGGDISPASLMGRVTADKAGKARMATGQGGDMGDLAKVGQRFLKEPKSSGTAERGLAYKLLGSGGLGAAAVGAPGVTAGGAAGVYALANLYNRLAPQMAKTEGGRQFLAKLKAQMDIAPGSGAAGAGVAGRMAALPENVDGGDNGD